MAHKKLYIICYDIEKDKQRNKIAKALENYGKRVNYSVFECFLTPAQHRLIYSKLMKNMNEKTDKIKIYAMCQNCYVSSDELGKKDYDFKKTTIFVE